MNSAVARIVVACILLARQIAAHVQAFSREGGSSERLCRSRGLKR